MFCWFYRISPNRMGEFDVFTYGLSGNYVYSFHIDI